MIFKSDSSAICILYLHLAVFMIRVAGRKKLDSGAHILFLGGISTIDFDHSIKEGETFTWQKNIQPNNILPNQILRA